jgi:hypothetical protein
MFDENRILIAFNKSRKLKRLTPNSCQIENIKERLLQIYSFKELQEMDESILIQQIERVWPIAQYVDER